MIVIGFIGVCFILWGIVYSAVRRALADDERAHIMPHIEGRKPCEDKGGY
jgi:hypothetical protein